MPLPSKKAQTQPSRKPPAASIRISRSVSPMVGVRFRFEPLLIGKQVRLHRARALVDRGGRLRHFLRQLVDLLGIIDQLGERLPVFLQHAGNFLEAVEDLFVGRRDRLQRVLDEFQARQRAGGDRLVGIDDEGIGERGRRLKLLGHLLGAELDRRHLVIVGIARRDRRACSAASCRCASSWFCAIRALSSLTLRMSAKILVKVRNSRSSLRDLLEPRRVGGALHRGLVDGVLQAGFGRQRRLAVLFLAGHHEIAGQRAVGDQLAVDIARQIGLRARCCR